MQCYVLCDSIQFVNCLTAWDDGIYGAMSHRIKRKIIECLRDADLSFTELFDAVADGNHGKFGYHLKELKGFVELGPSTKKYRLTDSGRLLDACIRDFRFITSVGKRLTNYVQYLGLGDHAVGFYNTEDFKHKLLFPFLEAGLQKNDAVIYLVSEHRLSSEDQAILRYGIDRGQFRTGALTIMSAREWYLKKGKAQAKTIIANWLALLKEKKKAGFTGLHVVGEMGVFFDYAKSKEVLRYEAELDRQFASDLCGLCLYDMNKLDTKQSIQLCNCHGHLISKGVVGKTIV